MAEHSGIGGRDPKRNFLQFFDRNARYDSDDVFQLENNHDQVLLGFDFFVGLKEFAPDVHRPAAVIPDDIG